MENVVERITYRGLTIKIIPDQDTEAPDSWGHEKDFLITTRNRYFDKEKDGFTMGGAARNEYDADWHVYPVYAYIHSGVALSLGRAGQFSDQFDSGHIGFLFLTKEAGYYGEEPGHGVQKAAEGIIETWNMFLSGQVYEYVIEDKDGDVLGSCCGCYGQDYCMTEAKSEADGIADSLAEEKTAIEATPAWQMFGPWEVPA